jgi:hypothetical protein
LLQKTERTTLLSWSLKAKAQAKIDATEQMVAACEELSR